MELAKRVVVFGTFVLFLAGICLICVALGTDHWVASQPTRNGTTSESSVHAGLFNGVRRLDSGLGPRVRQFNVRGEMDECNEAGTRCASFFNKGLWVVTILFAGVALLWAAIGVVFALTNTVIRPVATVAGPLGLYLWSSLAALSTLFSGLFFLIQFFTTMSDDVLLPDFHPAHAAGFTSKGLTRLSWSFFLMVGALASFLSVVVLLLVSGLDLRMARPKNEKEAPHLADRGVLMY